MSKKQFTAILVLLSVIILLLVILIVQTNQFYTNFLNTSNFLANLLDVLTGKVNSLMS